jgi:hypothetical protein
MSAAKLAMRAAVAAALLTFAPASLPQGSPLGISPQTASVHPGQALAFKVSGGTRPYVWSLATNQSGGSIGSTGKYVAGKTGKATDVVQVTDAGGSTATASVTVEAAAQAPDMSRPPTQ